MKKRTLKSLPILMQHLISYDTSHNAVTPAEFEEQCRLLAEAGWFGVSLREAEEFLLKGTPLPDKSFLMSFDDGYLDNYVYAWPILRKYGHKGVIFAVTDRISQAQRACEEEQPGGTTCRRTIEDVENGRCTRDELPMVDKLVHADEFGRAVRRDLFFNWDEARLMEQSGTISIAAHSTGHKRVFISADYSDVVQPAARHLPFIETVPPTFWGMPAFETQPELAGRAFLPSDELRTAIQALVPQDEASALAFFQSPAERERLLALVAQHKHALGEYESSEAQKKRLRGVMHECREVLERELGHAVRSFCWPWGVFCEEAREQALEAGFSVFYTTRRGVNPPAAPLAVNRVKAKRRTDDWTLKRLRLYSKPLLGALYSKLRF